MLASSAKVIVVVVASSCRVTTPGPTNAASPLTRFHSKAAALAVTMSSCSSTWPSSLGVSRPRPDRHASTRLPVTTIGDSGSRNSRSVTGWPVRTKSDSFDPAATNGTITNGPSAVTRMVSSSTPANALRVTKAARPGMGCSGGSSLRVMVFPPKRVMAVSARTSRCPGKVTRTLSVRTAS